MNRSQFADLQTFIEKQPDHLKGLLHYYVELLVSKDLSCTIRYKIPFFDHYSWICYLNPLKDHSLELAFLHGQELYDEHQILDKKDRKQISGVVLSDIKTVPDEWVRNLVAEAMVLDEHKYREKKKKR